jgi:hypothetical protein
MLYFLISLILQCISFSAIHNDGCLRDVLEFYESESYTRLELATFSSSSGKHNILEIREEYFIHREITTVHILNDSIIALVERKSKFNYPLNLDEPNTMMTSDTVICSGHIVVNQSLMHQYRLNPTYQNDAILSVGVIISIFFEQDSLILKRHLRF